MEKPLRFAALVRVSTEKQAKHGESLKSTQRDQIIGYVRLLGSDPDKHIVWYAGQQHATPDYEHKLVDKMLADSSKNLFDAVIVCDASRWSRDNLKSEEGLKILRENNILFYVGSSLHDLTDPKDCMMLAMFTAFNQFQAREQTKKSTENRIGRATNENAPTNGKLPYGRIYNGRRWDRIFVPQDKRKPGWDVDPDAKKLIERVAKRYLSGKETMPAIAASVGMNQSNLWKILTKKSGTAWSIQFRPKGLPKLHKTVPIKIPPLLDDSVIAQIHKKRDINKKFTRGQGKYTYVLSHFVYCATCGYALTGNPNHAGIRYYRHPSKHRITGVCVHCGKSIPADILEKLVLTRVLDTFGDAELMEKAIQKATPNQARIEELREEKEQLERDLKAIANKEAKVMDFGEDGTYSKDQVKSRLEKLREQKEPKEARLAIVKSELDNLPNPDDVKELSEWAMKVLDDSASRVAIKNLAKKPFAWKRNLVERAFAGFDAEGKRLGVYVHDVSLKKEWKIEIMGIVENCLEDLSNDDGNKKLIDPFEIDGEFQGVDNIDVGDRIARKPKKKSRVTNFPSSSPGPTPL